MGKAESPSSTGFMPVWEPGGLSSLGGCGQPVAWLLLCPPSRFLAGGDTPRSPALQQNWSIIKLFISPLRWDPPALRCLPDMAWDRGLLGRKRGFLELGGSGWGARGDVLPQEFQDAGMMCTQDPGMQG